MFIGRERNGTPLQYPCLENPMEGGAWKAAVRGVTKSRTRLSDFTFTFFIGREERASGSVSLGCKHVVSSEDGARRMVHRW